jgi:hypothetical protein
MSAVARSLVLIAVFGPIALWLSADLWRSLKRGIFIVRQLPYRDNPRYIIHRDQRPIDYWSSVVLGAIAAGTAILMTLIGIFFLIA